MPKYRVRLVLWTEDTTEREEMRLGSDGWCSLTTELFVQLKQTEDSSLLQVSARCRMGD